MTYRHDTTGTEAAAWRAHPGWAGLAPVDLDPADLDTLVVLAAHPDDESLGAGGLVATAHDAGLAVHVVVATLGERSHPRSPTHDAEALSQVRAAEAGRAVGLLAPGSEPRLLGLPDGALADHEDALTQTLVALVGDGRRTLLVAPWRRDGHPDHEAAGRAAATAAVRTGARLLEHPVWWWHWSRPEDADWTTLRAVRLTAGAQARKQDAIAAHRSQVAALSPADGDEVLLGPGLLAHFAGPVEVLVEEPAVDRALDDLHAEHDDPWGVDRRWYEQRKRALVLAALPRASYRRALEVGCSTGALTAALATRSDAVLALDASRHALAAARRRLADQPHVGVEQAVVPDDWPDGRFDLVVVSEVGYFLSPRALDRLVELVEAALDEDGVLVLCHWRHPVHGWVLDGPDVHERVRRASTRPVVASYVDRDVEVLVLGDTAVLPDPSR